jgi:hypothetical protein
VDSSGNPAMATLAATASRFSGVCSLRGLSGGVGTPAMAFGTIKGLVFDFSELVAETGTLYCVAQAYTACCPLRLTDCEIVGSAFGGVSPKGRRVLVQNPPSSPYAVLTTLGYETSYCIFTNSQVGLLPYNTEYNPSDNHHNVFIWNTDNSTDLKGGIGCQTVGVTYVDFSATHCTFYMSTARAGDGITPMLDVNSSTSDGLTVHSNLLYVQPASDVAATAPMPDALFNGAVTNGSTRGTMGYNYFALGTNMSELTSWTSGGFYNDSYLHPDWPTPSGTYTATYTSDVVTTLATIATVFNETTTAWTWTTAGGYDHNLPFDMRPIVGRDGSFTGGVIGAVEDDIIIPVPADPGGGIEFDAVLDSLPFYRPVFKAYVAAMVRVSRNDTFSHIDMRHYLKADQFDESIHRIAEVAPAGRYEGSLAGVGSATSFMIETDVTVGVSVVWVNGTTDTTFGMEVSETAIFDQAGIKSFIVNNTSSATATVQIIAFQ